MTNEEYIRNACRTISNLKNFSRDENITHCAIGCCTEAGELLDAVKKHLYYGKVLDVVNVKEELGDQLWYIANLLSIIDSSFGEAMEMNIQKLRQRYPEKFTKEGAENRNLESERESLENNGK